MHDFASKGLKNFRDVYSCCPPPPVGGGGYGLGRKGDKRYRRADKKEVKKEKLGRKGA